MKLSFYRGPKGEPGDDGAKGPPGSNSGPDPLIGMESYHEYILAKKNCISTKFSGFTTTLFRIF